MSNYRRLISYIYAYEGGVKGKNIGFAKIEIRNNQCRIHVNVKKVFLGGSDIGVYLLCPEQKIQVGRIFIRNGSGEFRTNVNAMNVENSGYSIEHCYGLSIYEQDNTWRCYTTIWEDAVVQAAEIQLAEVTAEKIKAQSAQISEPRSSISEEIEQELKREEQRKEDAVPWQETEENKNKFETMKEDKTTEEKPMDESAEKPTEESAEISTGQSTEVSAGQLTEESAEIPPGQSTKIPTGESTEISIEEPPEEPIEMIPAGEGRTGKIWIVNKPKEPEGETPSVKEDEAEIPSGEKNEAEMPMEESPVKEEPLIDDKPRPPEPGDPARLKELERLEQIENLQSSIWNRLQRRYPKVLAFDYANGCEILSIKPQDIGILPRENWVYGNNSFLLHGYYNYRHLILAKLNNPQGEPRYLLGVPGHYFSNEKHMASMFGFPNFVLAKKQPEEDGRFGYWYTDLRL